jgi:serine/threonine protein kinase
MLVRKDGHLLLSDFGIAKILEGTTNLTRVGTGIGTPQYMSPEQGTGQPVDRRSDIYSLGIVLFHCLTGRVPYTADSPLTITLKHLHDPLPVDRLVAENVPNSIVQVILKMTAKPPQERYQSMTELIDALTIALPHPFQRGRSSSISLPPIPSIPLPEAPKSQPLSNADNNGAGVVTITCFRCGAPNPSTRLYCTTCGDDLSNKRASADRYLGPNGRPVLARLTIQNGPMSGRSYRFHQDVTTIGRTNGNDFVIAGRTVSRRHARLWFDNGRWYLEDIQSVNGTFVNNTRIYQPVVLNDGDVVSFGDEIVIFNVTLGS